MGGHQSLDDEDSEEEDDEDDDDDDDEDEDEDEECDLDDSARSILCAHTVSSFSKTRCIVRENDILLFNLSRLVLQFLFVRLVLLVFLVLLLIFPFILLLLLPLFQFLPEKTTHGLQFATLCSTPFIGFCWLLFARPARSVVVVRVGAPWVAKELCC